MIPKRAIELAIEGGWLVEGASDVAFFQRLAHKRAWHAIALDPTFWQALGKSCGWAQQVFDDNRKAGKPISHWQHNANRFYDIILTGGDTEAFWDDILK